MYGGFTGMGVKTIVPAKAVAKLACRLVPDQDPQEILQVSFSHLEQVNVQTRNTLTLTS